MRRLALPGAVLLALLAVFLVARGTQPGPARVAVQGGQSAAVTSIMRSCPPLASGAAMFRAVPAASAGGGQQPARTSVSTVGTVATVNVPAGDGTAVLATGRM